MNKKPLFPVFSLRKHSRDLQQGRTDFSDFLNRIGTTITVTRKKKKKSNPRKEEQGFLKVQFFFENNAFLPGVKKAEKGWKFGLSETDLFYKLWMLISESIHSTNFGTNRKPVQCTYKRYSDCKKNTNF